jgi:DNA-binding CsgD family transcriptional regulator
MDYVNKYIYILAEFLTYRLLKQIKHRKVSPKLYQQIQKELISDLGLTYCKAVKTFFDTHKVENTYNLHQYLYKSFDNSIDDYFTKMFEYNKRTNLMSNEELEELEDLNYELDVKYPAKNIVDTELTWDSLDFRDLTRRELEVTCDIWLAGRSLADIAVKYQITIENVRKIKQRILDKLQISKINQELNNDK